MKLNYFKYSGIVIFIASFSVFYTCTGENLKPSKQSEVYIKLEDYTLKSFDLRVQKLLSSYESDYFAIIDYKTCARCSEDFIDNFFNDLTKTDTILIIFNDSVVYKKLGLPL